VRGAVLCVWGVVGCGGVEGGGECGAGRRKPRGGIEAKGGGGARAPNSIFECSRADFKRASNFPRGSSIDAQDINNARRCRGKRLDSYGAIGSRSPPTSSSIYGREDSIVKLSNGDEGRAGGSYAPGRGPPLLPPRLVILVGEMRGSTTRTAPRRLFRIRGLKDADTADTADTAVAAAALLRPRRQQFVAAGPSPLPSNWPSLARTL
jgi:hypothetical protein